MYYLINIQIKYKQLKGVISLLYYQMKRKLQIFKRFDLFSQSFGLLVDQNSKKKKTYLGGILSVITILASCCYLAYLLYMYFNNKFLPKITQTMYNQINQMEQHLENSLFGFTFVTNNQTIDELEQQTGKKYLNYFVQYQNYSQNSPTNYDNIPLKYCEDSSFEGYICLDLDNQPEYQKKIFLNSASLNQTFYSLVVQPCLGLPNCATIEEINNIVISSTFSFYIKIRINQFNQQKKELEETFQVDYIQFDDQLSVQIQYALQQQITNVQTGIIIQNSDSYNYISNFARVSTYFSNQNLLQKAGYEGYGCFLFQLYQNQILMQIQYPLLTEILAQFITVLNILLAFGFIAKLLSGTKVVQDISSIYLKEYYQSTAVKIIEDQSEQTPLKVLHLSSAEQIQSLHNKIYQADILKRKKESQISFKTRLKFLIDKIFCKKQEIHKKEINLQKESISQIIKKLDIFEVYKDLLQIKKAIRLLLTEDQFAALQFCGCEMKFDSKFQEEFNSKLNKKQKTQQWQNSNQQSSLAQNNIQNTSMNKLKINSKLNEYEEGNSAMVVSVLSDKEQQIQSVYKSVNKKQVCNYHQKIESSKSLKQEKSCIQRNLKEILTTNQIQQELQNKLLLERENHLQKIEEMINNKQTLFQQLSSFIERVKSNNKISPVDIQIYSSLINKNYFQNCNQINQLNKQNS
ncbi:transmembrane protein, putative (macronuclear) [Tetrahymena thermophila SB210]|uniref:Transmembrane protein, putative n=1 Tax=Tetrahymena thermophila (strain SB210) TaxID=312017 RepID=I7LU76_TETTS|nr:transmembrane protein, putative [Tetrahymena thermophila SB210]EAR90752.2 transmembrane protein, putative [Tetrahymena thermophila SB210]|eukprot:XP_001010997.2 transmembrane protein, putative [Tetrahymena thermophila SB210]